MIGRVLVLGAGHAGIQLADELRRRSYSGGITIVDTADEWPYQRPPLSKSLREAAGPPRLLRTPDFYKAKDIDLRLGVTVVDADLDGGWATTTDHRRIDFTHLVVATGATPRTIRVDGDGEADALVLRDLTDARCLLERATAASTAAVVGGGYIGLEITAQLVEMGLRCSIFEAEDRLLSRTASPRLATLVHQAFTSRGCAVHLGGRPAVRTDGRSRWRILTESKPTGPPYDLVVSGVGVAPRIEVTELLGLATDAGVLVDDQLRTSHPRAFAIGDVAQLPSDADGNHVRFESVQNAVDQAAVCAAVICGDETAHYSAVPWTWSDLFDMKIQVAGDVTGATATVVRGSLEQSRCSLVHFRDDELLGVECVNRPGEFVQFRRLLGTGAQVDRRLVQDLDQKILHSVLP